MVSFLFVLTFSILLTLVFVIPGLFLSGRWLEILGANDFNIADGFTIGDMKVPTFYSMPVVYAIERFCENSESYERRVREEK